MRVPHRFGEFARGALGERVEPGLHGVVATRMDEGFGVFGANACRHCPHHLRQVDRLRRVVQRQGFLLLLGHPELDFRDEATGLVFDQFDIEVCDGIDLGDGELEHIAFEKAVFLLQRIFGVGAAGEHRAPPLPGLPGGQPHVAVAGTDLVEHDA